MREVGKALGLPEDLTAALAGQVWWLGGICAFLIPVFAWPFYRLHRRLRDPHIIGYYDDNPEIG